MNIGNPLLRKQRTGAYSVEGGLSINDVINKTGLMFLTLMAGFAYTWHQALMGEDVMTLSLGAGVGGFVLAMIVIFARLYNPLVVLPYALLKGLFLGGISAFFEQMYPGIAFQAVAYTFACFGGILIAYMTKTIRYSEGLAKFIKVSLISIVAAYVISFIGSFFGAPIAFLHDSSPLSIGISLFIVCVATLSFVMDFEAIKQSIQNGAPKQMSWYFGFALTVSLVWLYIEMLKLLVKLRGRD